jgi:hypothetical protein
MVVVWAIETYTINQPFRLPEKAFLTGLLRVLSAFSVLVIFVFHKSNYDDDSDYNELTKPTIVTLEA